MMQDAPRPVRAGDRDRQLGRPSGRTASGRVARRLAEQHGRASARAGSAAAGRQLERPAEDAEARGRSTSRRRAASASAIGPRRRAGRRGAPRPRPGDGRRRRGCVAAADARASSSVVAGVDPAGRATAATVRSSRWRSASSGSALRRGSSGGRPRAARTAAARCRVDAAPAAPRAGRRRSRRRRRAGLGGGQEPLEVAQPVAPVAARIDPVVAQPAGVAPGPDRVRMHAKQPGGLGDRQGRVGGSWTEGWSARLDGGNVKSIAPSLPISQFLPIGRWSRPVSRVRPAGQPDVGEGRARRQPRPITTTASTAKPRVADEPGSLAGAARVARLGPGLGEAARARPARRPARPCRPRRRSTAPPTAHATAPTTAARTSASAMSTSPPARQATATSGRRRSPPVRTRIASAGSSVVRTSGRPSPAVSRGAPGVVEAGHADDDRVLDRRDLLDAAGGPASSGAVPAGTRSATSAAVPTDSRGTTTSPTSSAAVVDGDGVEALADLERRPARGRPRTTPSRRRRGPGAGSGGRRAGDGRRPRTRPRRRSGRGP